MPVAQLEEFPPYVNFEFRPEEDREATIKSGCYIARDVAYAIITPPGSKDRIERVAAEWLAKIKRDAQEGRIKKEWYNSFVAAFEAWEKGQEAPTSGTAVEKWPPLSPAQLATLRAAGIRTVEILAAANEEIIGRLGMGGRALKQQAIDWLKSANEQGKVTTELSALRAENADLVERNKSLEERLSEMSRKLDLLVSEREAQVPAAKRA